MKKTILAILLSFALIFSGCAAKDTFNEEISVTAPVEISVPASLNPNGYCDLSNTLYGWGLKKNVNAPPDIPQNIKELCKKYGAYYISGQEKCLFLTFDEGYENGYTSKILDILKENSVPAAFFVTGPYLKNETELIDRMLNEGHIVGNHTVHHPSLPQVRAAEDIKNELCELDEMFQKKYGKEMKYFRAPRGEYSERTLAITRDLGYTNVFWSFAYKDWDVKNQKGTENAYKQIMNGVHDGAILLLHAVSKDNTEALDTVIKELKNKGYSFKSLDDLE